MSGIILGLGSASERRRYIAKSSPIGLPISRMISESLTAWVHTQIDSVYAIRS